MVDAGGDVHAPENRTSRLPPARAALTPVRATGPSQSDRKPEERS
jgi:hypothetical protein